MKAEPLSLFDRVAIGFGATIAGAAAALALAFPFYYEIILESTDWDLLHYGELLLWTWPVRFGLLSGVVGFFFPRFAADCLGKAWEGVTFLWRD